MKELLLNNTTYQFVKGYRNVDSLRLSLSNLAESTFEFSLEDWYQKGYWGNQYIPYSLVHDQKVVSNISVNEIDLHIDGKKKLGIQLGTVMTDEDYKNKGLNRYLMEQVLAEWENNCDFIYLFANDTVLDFYPKFNFRKVDQYIHSKSINSSDVGSLPAKFDLDAPANKELFVRSIIESVPQSRISMIGNDSLIMFYCDSFKKDCIYHLEESNTFVVAEFHGDVLNINDAFSDEPVELDEVIQSMATEDINRVELGFTPSNDIGYQPKTIEGEDTLFIYENGFEDFEKHQWMFPVLSHA